MLIEKRDADGRLSGHSEHFAPMLLEDGEVGAVTEVRVTGREGLRLTAGIPLAQTLSPAA